MNFASYPREFRVREGWAITIGHQLRWGRLQPTPNAVPRVILGGLTRGTGDASHILPGRGKGVGGVDLEQLMYEAMCAGLRIVSHNGRPVVSGPVGTEQLAIELAAALEAAELTGGNAAIDALYVFGQPQPSLASPGPFTRDEYSRLADLRRRFLAGPPAGELGPH